MLRHSDLFSERGKYFSTNEMLIIKSDDTSTAVKENKFPLGTGGQINEPFMILGFKASLLVKK